MKTVRIEIRVTEKEIHELTADEQRWRQAAIDAAATAYAPYSNFGVGAAAILMDGTVVAGSNQENAAYPSGLCAERVALFAAAATYPQMPVEALAVVAVRNGEVCDGVSPCGGCRQTFLEVEARYGRPFRLLLYGRTTVRIVEAASQLMPLPFGADDLR